MKKTSRPRKGDADAPARARRMRPVCDLLPEVGGAAFRRFGFVQSAIVSRWPEIVGPRYAAVSSPESIRFPIGRKSEGVLTLIVEGAHAPMMQHVAPAIIERVNRFFGYTAVVRLSFRQGIVQAEKARSRRAAPSPEPGGGPAELAGEPSAGRFVDPRELPAELGDSLRAVVDPELRACLESLARGIASGEGTPVVTTIPVVGRIGGERKR